VVGQVLGPLGGELVVFLDDRDCGRMARHLGHAVGVHVVKIPRLDLLETIAVVVGEIHVPLGGGFFAEPAVLVVIVCDLLPTLVDEGGQAARDIVGKYVESGVLWLMPLDGLFPFLKI